mmetsp:Transcript_302/g.847  ORF Transcript_302/g.847 Transcript_302/m.847 type:complete len:376 (+) Transcript_302:209-1336(+)
MDKSPIVTISYNDLPAADADNSCGSSSTSTSSPSPALLERIGRAFGSSPDSLGILAVTDVPSFPSLRRRLLPLARTVATLSPEQLSEVTVPEAGYQVGWSHGKERVEGDKFDVGKGSYYANPLADDFLGAVTDRRRRSRKADDKEGGSDALFGIDDEVPREELDRAAAANPAFFAPNVWPSNSVPELEGTAKEMGSLVRDVGRRVARLCDAYVAEQCPGYSRGKLDSVLTNSLCCKARLLHYFAAEEEQAGSSPDAASGDGNDAKDADFSDWCGWHNDHGSLTGLVPAMYLDADGRPVDCPDPSAGLYIKSRSGRLVRAAVPEGALAFQVGETTQVHTGGVLQATPHAVRGCRRAGGNAGEGVTREAFAVFMEPE